MTKPAGQANTNMHAAKRNKNDEFYTQLTDIEKELGHYQNHFRDKVVFCNCDDPLESNFWKYFWLNFQFLGLKKLIATHFEREQPSYKLEAELVDGRLVETRTPLQQNGDFRSPECVAILDASDIVVTNPPFSLFREYIAQLDAFGKQFLVIGHQNAITYKEIFKLIKGNRLWLGFGFSGNAAHFINRHYEDYATAGNHKEGMIRVSGVVWFTNLPHSKRNEHLILYKSYSEQDYPKYDNYDAIEVSKTKDIPVDYSGAMGVPVTFMNKYNPEQFEIVGMAEDNGKGFSGGLWDGKNPHCIINGQKKFKRIFIRSKNQSKVIQ